MTKLILCWEILFHLGVPDMKLGVRLLSVFSVNDKIRMLYLAEIIGHQQLIQAIYNSILKPDSLKILLFYRNDIQYLALKLFPELKDQNNEEEK